MKEVSYPASEPKAQPGHSPVQTEHLDGPFLARDVTRCSGGIENDKEPTGQEMCTRRFDCLRYLVYAKELNEPADGPVYNLQAVRNCNHKIQAVV